MARFCKSRVFGRSYCTAAKTPSENRHSRESIIGSGRWLRVFLVLRLAVLGGRRQRKAQLTQALHQQEFKFVVLNCIKLAWRTDLGALHPVAGEHARGFHCAIRLAFPS